MNILKGKMKERGFIQQDMAEILGLSLSTFQYKLKGERDFDKTEIDKMLNLFQVTYEELFRKEGGDVECATENKQGNGTDEAGS